MSSHFPLLATDLVIGYKNKQKIQIAGPLNIKILEGKLYGLIGINGIGKSTLIKTLGGLLPPINGKTLINGENIFKLTKHKRAKYISVVLTEQINAGFSTVKEIVKMGRYPYTNWQFSLSNHDKKIVDASLKSVEIYDKRHKLFSQLSDGNKQKAIIAKALAQDTPVLILDEPTVHLDIQSKVILLKMLQKLTKNNNKTILFSGHDLDCMLHFCDKLILMTPNHLSIDTPSSYINSGEISKAFNLNLHHFPINY